MSFQPSEKINTILATDCGSTTSKARFFKKINGEYRYVCSGEAPTTVEAPYEDVCLGVKNAVREVEELTGHKLLSDKGIIVPSKGEKEGVDVYVTTSSAGGGLQMMVGGVIKIMTAESAERAALGAGAIVMDVLSIDDGRKPYQQIQAVRRLRPDMILIAGGTDGGQIKHVAAMVELIATADPKARFSAIYKLPIVYAGNVAVREHIKKVFGDKFALKIVDNIRPTLEVEIVEPARAAVHEAFMEHVMSHAPGYDKLMTWTDVPIMPTPYGEGTMFRVLAEAWDLNVIGVGLGGATTNIYSVYDEKFARSVSANLGMSYSICNVLKGAGIENITRWLPFEMEEKDLTNRLRNKMIRPTTIPQTLKELMIEHAVAREALRLAFEQHKLLARGLRGIRQKQRTVGEMFEETVQEESYIDLMNISVVGGTGGLLSHAPNRTQSALILIDGFRPEGVTMLVQDSVFMIPHLGVLSTVNKQAAMEVFEKDCLVRLGTCIAPKVEDTQQLKIGEEVLKIEAEMPDGTSLTENLKAGEMKVIPLGEGNYSQMMIHPNRKCDVGAGNGKVLNAKIEGGVVGVILDGRGRPLVIPETAAERRDKMVEWLTSLKVYPEGAL